jgi:hypothetical protein
MSFDNLNPKEDTIIYDALVKDMSPALFCDNCGFYPIQPVHGHFVCPSCHLPTKCCEGGPMELDD